MTDKQVMKPGDLVTTVNEPAAYQYRTYDPEYDEWGDWEDCGECAFEKFSAEARIPDNGMQTRKLYVSSCPSPVVMDALTRLRSIVSDPRALPRRKEWVSGQQYSYVLLDNVEAMVEEACSAIMLVSSSQQVTP